MRNELSSKHLMFFCILVFFLCAQTIVVQPGMLRYNSVRIVGTPFRIELYDFNLPSRTYTHSSIHFIMYVYIKYLLQLLIKCYRCDLFSYRIFSYIHISNIKNRCVRHPVCSSQMATNFVI